MLATHWVVNSPVPGSRLAAGDGGSKGREVSCFEALGFGYARSIYQNVKSYLTGFRLNHLGSSREPDIGLRPACPCVRRVSFVGKPEVIKVPLAISVQPDQQRPYGTTCGEACDSLYVRDAPQQCARGCGSASESG